MLNSEQDNPKLLRRIGLLGDIHCEDGRLAAALAFFQTQQLDLVCAVGDLVDGPGDVNRTIELLRAHQVIAVRGNHERWLFAGEMRSLPEVTSRFDLRSSAWEYLPQLPTLRRLETVAGRALLCHGLGADDMAGVWPADDVLRIHSNYPLWQLVSRREYRFVLNGHTHQRLVRSFGEAGDELTIINAGTLYRQHRPCVCVADFGAGTVQFFDLVAELAAGQFNLVAAETFRFPVAPVL
ncbi:MAG: metallophosphoesterase family protein [Acidobacteria bacterium]|nr:metallophosphoesterase family protein [Acidobacteriota bacterium]MBI3422338.1 metallophosphoesterase family protein [Acidobacteriota bacterium]